MSINFHCESCKKKIKAPDATGGKWGKCPYCNHRCYIPLPKTNDEPELKLAPIDEASESHIHDLMRETYNLTQNLLRERKPIEDEPEDNPKAQKAADKEVIKQCIIYLRQMADGELTQAVRTLDLLKHHKKAAVRILSAMARSERPEPELSDLADGVLQGLIRDASAKLSS